MFKFFNIFIFICFFTSVLFAQNGFDLNKTKLFLQNPEKKSFENHVSVISYSDSHLPDDSITGTSFLPIASGVFYISGYNNPLFHISEGIAGQIRQHKIKGNFSLYHETSSFPLRMKFMSDSLDFIPHNGNFFYSNKNFYSWLNARGSIAYSPYNYLSLIAGNDKHFLGPGFNSLFLSDQSDAFPFFSTSLKIWHIRYISTVGFLKDIYFEDNEFSYKRKYGTFHYISWNITPSINLNLFEAVIWRGSDTSLYNGLNLHYLNPVIFMRPVEYSQGSTDNELVGIGLNGFIYKNVLLYSQLILDEFHLKGLIEEDGYFTNKHGFQVGIRDNASLNQNFKWLIEYNWLRPFTYTHYTTLQVYGNKRQPLAHHLGANFKETTGMIFYGKNEWYVSVMFSFSEYGKDSVGSNYGNDIYNNYLIRYKNQGNYILQGIKTTRKNLVIKSGYLIRPEWNMSLEAGLLWQNEKSQFEPDNYSYFFLGLKTLLYNDEWFE